MKEINLLPSNIAFDYKKFILVKLSIFIIILNIILLVLISSVNIYINNGLEKKLSQKKAYLSKIDNINSKFKVYKQEYVKLKKRLVKLKNEINYYEKIVVLHRSAYADSIVFLNTFFDGVWFDSVTYKEGSFNISGYSPSKANFQRFYGKLEANRYIGDIKFFYVKQKSDMYVFKINYKVVFR